MREAARWGDNVKRDELDDLADEMRAFIVARGNCSPRELAAHEGAIKHRDTIRLVEGLAVRAQWDDILLPDEMMSKFAALAEKFWLEDEFEELREHQEALKKRLSDASA